jgi:thiol-disulfide isomerase/thioredoxin
MIKKFRYLMLLSFWAIFAGFSSMAQERQINFEHDTWKKIAKKAKAENKLIFMDCYTSWCGPCKLMAAEVFTQNAVADFFNSNFVNCKFDMEKGEGLELRKKLPIQFYPTFFLLNSDGTVIHKVVGSSSADEFIQYFTEGKTDNENYSALEKHYQSGERNANFMFKYLRSLRVANEESKETQVATDYFKSLKNEDLKNNDMWLVINYFLNDPTSKHFQYMVENRQFFYNMVGAEVVNSKIRTTYHNALSKQLEYYYPESGKPYNEALEDTMIIDLKKYDLPFSKNLLALIYLNKYSKENSWDNYAEVISAIVRFNLMDNDPELPETLSSAISLLIKGTSDPKWLSNVQNWSQYAIDRESNIGKRALLIENQADMLQKIGESQKADEDHKAAKTANDEAEKQGKKISVVPMMRLTTGGSH